MIVVPRLPPWEASPVKLAEIWWAPTIVGVYVTEQLDDWDVPASVHGLLKVPVLFVWSANVPEGVMVVPGDVSVTITVHVDGFPSVVDPQEIVVVVIRAPTAMLVEDVGLA